MNAGTLFLDLQTRNRRIELQLRRDILFARAERDAAERLRLLRSVGADEEKRGEEDDGGTHESAIVPGRLLGLWRRFELELFDPKSETFTELKKHLAAWWLVSDERVREEIARSVHGNRSGNAPVPRPRSDGVAGGLDQLWRLLHVADYLQRRDPAEVRRSIGW